MILQASSDIFFDFDLDKNLIAHEPTESRRGSRLLLYKDKQIKDCMFADIVDLIPANAVLIRNNSRVVPARINLELDGVQSEIFFVKKIDTRSFEAMVRPGKKFKLGRGLQIGGYEFKVCNIAGSGLRTLTLVSDQSDFDIFAFLAKYGAVPLPPYIKTQDPNQYRERYQTVFAKHHGSVAAPTASLHFDDIVLSKLQKKGVVFEDLCLHVSFGTFAPIKTSIEEHVMHKEYCHIDEQTAKSLTAYKKAGRPLIALGTTALRVLQTAYRPGFDDFVPFEGETDIFIHPPFDDFCVDALLTNFHLPASTLLLLVNALVGPSNCRRIYEHAMRKKYRFFSFGDSSLLFRT